MITFHGGMQAIGYNWGSFNYYHGVYASPDDNSMHDVAAQLSRFAGTGNQMRTVVTKRNSVDDTCQIV